VLWGPLRGRRWIAGAGIARHWLGYYEYGKQLALQRAIRPGMTVYDIGAHTGFYTLLASRATGPAGRVLAFEPVPRNLALLRRHLELNQAGNVTVHAAAVSDVAGLVSFEEAADGYAGAIAPGGAQRVRAVRLDDLFLSQEAPPADVMKVDVEGAELAVLSGAEKMIASGRPAIFLATHNLEATRRCRALLESWGYGVSALGGPAGAIEDCDELVAVGPPGRGVAGAV